MEKNNNVIADSEDLEDIYTFIYSCWEFLYVAVVGDEPGEDEEGKEGEE